MAGARQACLILCHRELYNKEHEEKLQKKKREKKFSNTLAVTQIFSKWLKMKNSDSDPFFWGGGGLFKKKDFYFFYPVSNFGLWQWITQREQKDLLMNLHYSHTLGHSKPLK